MVKRKKRLLSALLILCMIITINSSVFAYSDASKIQEVLSAISADYQETVSEWTVIDMAANGTLDAVNKDKLADYINSATNLVNTSTKITDFAKTVISFSAIGLDSRQITASGGSTISIIDKIANSEGIGNLNNAVFALLAFDSGDYDVENKNLTRESIIEYIKNSQHDDGGWSFSDDKQTASDPDMTGMAVSALAKYYIADSDTYSVKATVDSAISCMSSLQKSDGGFISWGTKNSNSAAMIVTALSALGIDADTDSRFIKDNGSALSALLSYVTADNKFGYTDAETVNAFSTEQCFRALAAYDGFKESGLPFNVYLFNKIDDTSLRPQQKRTIDLRVEGISENKLNERNKKIEFSTQLLTVFDAVKAVLSADDYVCTSGYFGEYFSSFFGENEGSFGIDYDGWQYRVNGKSPSVGVGSYALSDGDEVVFYYGGSSIAYPKGPVISYNETNTVLQFSYEKMTYGPAPDYALQISNEPLEAAKVIWSYGEDLKQEFLTDSEGKITIPYEQSEDGKHSLQIEKLTEEGGRYLPLAVRFAPDFSVEVKHTIVPPTSDGGTDNISVTFSLIGDVHHTKPENHRNFESWINAKKISVPAKSTVKTVFEKALSAEKIEYICDNSGYVSSINNLSEFDNGPSSGWTYTVNGEMPNVAMTEYTLKNGDEVVWKYNDGDAVSSGSAISSSSGGGSSVVTIPSNKENIQNRKTFTDLEKHWAKEDICYLADKNIISGKTETEFAPNDKITRAEFITLLYRLSGETIDEDKSDFNDVSEKDWFFGAVCWAVKNKISSGITEKEFSPNSEITREQIATMLSNFAEYMKYQLEENDESTTFEDLSSIAEYAQSAVLRMQKSGIISGRENGRFCPRDTATRAEAARMLAVLIKSVNK